MIIVRGGGLGGLALDYGGSNHLHPLPCVWRLRIFGARTGAVAIQPVQGLEHPGIRDWRRSQDCKSGVTHCKPGGTGAGDKFCPPIQDEMKMLGLGRAGEAESGAGMR
jgi:hypothetical protein